MSVSISQIRSMEENACTFQDYYYDLFNNIIKITYDIFLDIALLLSPHKQFYRDCLSAKEIP